MPRVVQSAGCNLNSHPTYACNSGLLITHECTGNAEAADRWRGRIIPRMARGLPQIMAPRHACMLGYGLRGPAAVSVRESHEFPRIQLTTPFPND